MACLYTNKIIYFLFPTIPMHVFRKEEKIVGYDVFLSTLLCSYKIKELQQYRKHIRDNSRE